MRRRMRRTKRVHGTIFRERILEGIQKFIDEYTIYKVIDLFTRNRYTVNSNRYPHKICYLIDTYTTMLSSSSSVVSYSSSSGSNFTYGGLPFISISTLPYATQHTYLTQFLNPTIPAVAAANTPSRLLQPTSPICLWPTAKPSKSYTKHPPNIQSLTHASPMKPAPVTAFTAVVGG